MNLIDLKQAPIVDKAQEGATLFALNTDGTVERISAKNVGGSGMQIAKLKLDMGDASSASLMSLMQGTATVDATRSQMLPTYTATCDNMTFEEAAEIIESGEPLGVYITAEIDNYLVTDYTASCAYDGYSCIAIYFVGTMVQLGVEELYWTADGISTAYQD